MIEYNKMFADIGKKLIKYFKRNQESPLETLIKFIIVS
jgi:hypothetical protein